MGDEREGPLTRAEFGEVDRLYVRDDLHLTEFLRATMPPAIIIMSHNCAPMHAICGWWRIAIASTSGCWALGSAVNDSSRDLRLKSGRG